jgi:hypothetical protein
MGVLVGSEGDAEKGEEDLSFKDTSVRRETKRAMAEGDIKVLAMEFKKRNDELGLKVEEMKKLLEERKGLIDMLLDMEWEEQKRGEEVGNTAKL